MIKKKKLKSLLQYLQSCENNREIIYFENPVDAYNYGHKIRDNIENEHLQEHDIVVDISGNTVRIKISAKEPACVGLGCDK